MGPEIQPAGSRIGNKGARNHETELVHAESEGMGHLRLPPLRTQYDPRGKNDAGKTTRIVRLKVSCVRFVEPSLGGSRR